MTAARFGRDVLGPILAEFCLRLWSFASFATAPDDTALLFCARGGLRLQAAYEAFLAAGGLASPVHIAPLMVSRVAASWPALMAGTDAAASVLAYEFSGRTLADVVTALTGKPPRPGSEGRWATAYSFDGLTALLKHPDGSEAASSLAAQAALFKRHLDIQLAGRRRAILVDTGLHGTTMQMLSSCSTPVDYACALMARADYRSGVAAHRRKTFGLLVESDSYKPWRVHTSILRYWHLIESVFEPDLPSVRHFTDTASGPRSNLEVDGWRERIAPRPDSIFAGALSYIQSLPEGPAATVIADTAAAWTALHRAIVWPGSDAGQVLDVGFRSHDFGLDDGSVARPWTGAISALRGHSLWREGEIARSGSSLRWPLLALIEAGYTLRGLRNATVGRVLT